MYLKKFDLKLNDISKYSLMIYSKVLNRTIIKPFFKT